MGSPNVENHYAVHLIGQVWQHKGILEDEGYLKGPQIWVFVDRKTGFFNCNVSDILDVEDMLVHWGWFELVIPHFPRILAKNLTLNNALPIVDHACP